MKKVLAVIACVMAVASSALADVSNMGTGLVSLEFVHVGNPGNPLDPRYPGLPYGAVTYDFEMGIFEVTSGQYCEFLNAVAATDTYGLYNTLMWEGGYVIDKGCRIKRDGTSGSYTYSVAPEWANRPVNYVSWGDAARFCNWLTNGMPNGGQNLTTTEDGSYHLDGAMTWAELMSVTRKPNAQYVIPTIDEWHKAAYHKNDGITDHYWPFPTGTDIPPINDLFDPDPGNNANYEETSEDYTIGPPYFATEVGEFENSGSPYGTFDQGGNVWEWTEGVSWEWTQGTMLEDPGVYSQYGRATRGGSYGGGYIGVWTLASGEIRERHPSYEINNTGFRVASVPTAPIPIADAGQDQFICNDIYNRLVLDGTGSQIMDGVVAFYDWDIAHTENTVYNQTASGPTPTISGLHVGVYKVTLTVTDGNGYFDTDQMILIVKDTCDVFKNLMKGDLDTDGDVDGNDLEIFSRYFGTVLSTP